jgi:hypothetical protein
MSASDALKAQTSDAPKPDPKSDRLDLKAFAIVQLSQNRQSLRLLGVIDELDRQIKASAAEKASKRRSLLQARSAAAQEFAKHLDANPSQSRQLFFATDDGRYVWIVLELRGSPSRAGRKQAEEWMASRGQFWKGDTTRLRETMRLAIRNGEELPAGNFGFWIERTIKIVDESMDGFLAELPHCLRSR